MTEDRALHSHKRLYSGSFAITENSSGRICILCSHFLAITMSLFSGRPIYWLTAASVILAITACKTGRAIGLTSRLTDKALPTLSNDAPSVCTPNEAVISQGGSYSENVDLTSSVALPGESGVDVVMTGKGAIAAVNSAEGATLYWVSSAGEHQGQCDALGGYCDRF
jgi:hypothetical protein